MVDFIKRDKDDIYSKPILGFLFKNQKFIMALKVVVLALFLYAIYLGFAHTGKENTFTWALFWGIFWSLFMVITLPTFGRIFCGICPHGFMGKYITKFGLKKTMPKWMQNRYIGLLLLVIGWWGIYYMFPGVYRTPLGTAILFTVMTLLSFVIYFLYKDMSYCKYICPIGTLTRAYGKLSFTWLGTYKSACDECRTFECATACPYNLKPFTFDHRNSMMDCTLCMDCSAACEAVSFKYKKPSFSLFSKFRIVKAEVWAFVLILASIPITMSFHHGIGRSNAAGDMIWSKTAEFFKGFISFGAIDPIGLFAFLYAMLFTILAAIIGMFIASKILKKDFSSTFYDLGYSYAPLFILGSIAHSLETFFTRGYERIVEGFAYGFGFSVDVASLAKRGDSWLHIFGLLKWVAIAWALIILYKRMKLLDVDKVRKMIAYPFAASLIIFFLSVNMYRGYILDTYGRASGGHGNHGGGGAMFQSVPKDKAILLQSGEDKASCITCGMKLPMFYKTNHAAHLDEAVRQYCSIHCLAEEKNIKKMPIKDFKVVDVKSLKFIDAKSAFYVVGSKKKATMSKVSKYAFAKKEDAVKFSKRYQGKVVNFDAAFKIALKDFDTSAKKMIKEVSATDVVYFTDKNPAAKKRGGHGGHMHGGSRGQVPTKKVWPVFMDRSDKLSCIGDINAELYVLDANLKTIKAKQSRDRGCKSVSFKMPDNGYYNLFYTNKTVDDNTLYLSTAKYEYMRFNHSNDAVYDDEKMSAHTIKEVPFDILRLREEGETFYHRLYSGDKIRIKVVLDSKPVEGANLTLSTKTGWSKTIKTDKDGIATFLLLKDYFPEWEKFDRRHKNKFLLTASYTQESKGEHDDEAYENIKYTTTYASLYYPGESGYMSYAYGLLAATVAMVISGFVIYWYRRRREKPFKEVNFNEKN
ncbi:nitrous oxide reductase accessory protein NosL [Sulfurovum sp. CS9]|uniref:nitrous oxide reductase accessory protein NosL n=1 Tax=Sulfurovum sp. CS9 TaxID=3391146 RepID=UPI0039E757F9